MITIAEFAKLLIRQRDDGITFKTFMPRNLWVKVLGAWAIGLAVSGFMIWHSFPVGLFLLGFVVSQIYMTVSLKYKSAQYWGFTQELIDWEKVKNVADEKSS